MRYFLTLIGLIAYCVSMSSAQTPSWQRVTNLPGGCQRIFAFHDTVIAWYGSYLRVSTNSGLTWPDSLPVDGYLPFQVFFLDSRRGWTNVKDQSDDVAVYYTTDFARSWQRSSTTFPDVYDAVNLDLTRLQFVNPLVGYAAFPTRNDLIYPSTIWKTTDGGWTFALKDTSRMNIHCLGFADTLRGWIGGDARPSAGIYSLRRTTDGGATWSYETSSAFSQGVVTAIDASHPGAIWAASSQAVHRETNGAWATFSHGLGDVYRVQAVSTGDIRLAAGNAGILSTNDGATITGSLSWEDALAIPGGRGVTDLFMQASDRGWAIANETVYRLGFAGGVEEDLSGRSRVGLSLTIVPNPTSHIAMIQYHLTSSEEVTLALCTLLGEPATLMRCGFKKPGTHVQSVDISAFDGGLYIVRLSTQKATRVQLLHVVR